jgi:hypothetical protein
MTSFNKGVAIGIFLGIVLGVVLGLMLSGKPSDISPARIDELNRKIAAAEDARARADKQLEDFQKVAEQMALSFQTLERRFNALAQAQAGDDTTSPTPPAAK